MIGLGTIINCGSVLAGASAGMLLKNGLSKRFEDTIMQGIGLCTMFIGIGGAMLGVPVMEPIACVAICLCILKVAYDILKDSIDKMLDTACSPEYEASLRSFIAEQDGVRRVDKLQTRRFGSKIYIDAEIGVDGSISLFEAHAIAESVHNAVEKRDQEIKHIMIHENPVMDA